MIPFYYGSVTVIHTVPVPPSQKCTVPAVSVPRNTAFKEMKSWMVFLYATGGAAWGERAEQAGEGLRLGVPRDVQVLQVHRLRDALPGQDL